VKDNRKKSETAPICDILVTSTQHVDNENAVRRSNTVPVQSTQQRKLDEYVIWEQEQQEKRQRLERYLKFKPKDRESNTKLPIV
jgi:hypothetical protein